MMRRRDMVLGGLALAAGMASGAADAAVPVWQTLPPTPLTPPYHAVRRDMVDRVTLWSGHFNGARGGRPVVLLHGGYANSNYFATLAQGLARGGRRVIALDTRGHGRSTRSDEGYTYDLLARDVVALLDRWHIETADIVGWSDGANTGIAMALAHPQRAARVFCFGGNANISGLNPGFADTPTFQAYLARVAQEYRQLSPTPDQFDAFSRQISVMWANEPRWRDADLRRITCPLTVAIAAHDEAISQAHARYMASIIPGARLDVIPGVSHFAMLQDPARFHRSVNTFLAAPPPPAAERVPASRPTGQTRDKAA